MRKMNEELKLLESLSQKKLRESMFLFDSSHLTYGRGAKNDKEFREFMDRFFKGYI